MNFVQTEFLGFMAILFAVYWQLGRMPQGRLLQNGLLVVGSAIFYGWVHPWFLILLYFSACLDFFIAQGIVRFPRYRDYLLMLSLLGNLGVLAYFKYFNFFVENVIGAFQGLGLETNLTTLAILLPVGVSFYTFQTHVLLHRCRIEGSFARATQFLDYLVYVTFFPQLVAGPIERAGNLLPQVERPRTFEINRVLDGLSLALWGAFKKLCVADTLAPYIDKVFVLEQPAAPMIWMAAIAFSIQIFADFSGYTDIARGTARMLGFELSENFKRPFLAATTPEFWQRWHITLSFWIRDYVMVPLLGTGSRLSVLRFVWATMVTFILIGFWHGASWNFILFGAFHGAWMAIYTLAGRAFPGWVDRHPVIRPLAVVFHFFAVSTVGSLFFREVHIDRLLMYFTLPPFQATFDEWLAASVMLGMTLVCAIPLVLSHVVEKYTLPRVRDSVWYLPMQTTAWAVFGLAIFVFYRVSQYDFIYFEF